MRRSVHTFLRWRLWAPLAARLYRVATRHLSWWPLGLQPRRVARRRPAGPGRIAYYQHTFPTLSETFVQREISALRHGGIDVVVVAEAAGQPDHLDADARRFMQSTHYLEPLDRLAGARRHWARRRPLVMLNLYLYTVFRRHTAIKTYGQDRQLFGRAIRLASTLERLGATHVHSPWAATDALVALLAARLLRIPYSMHARAYDLHARTSIHGLRERLRQAQFVVTNSRYNHAFIRSRLGLGPATPVHIIFNGIDPQRFHPSPRPVSGDGTIDLLSVARLVEQKGLVYLIRACRLLRDAGYTVRCRIIGGRTRSGTNHYIVLQKLRRALAVESEVIVCGAQSFDQVLAAYAGAGIFVLPCVIAPDGRRDVTPNAVIEAMAMQLPVISTTVSALPEVIEDGVSGLLVAPYDEHALAQAIIRLVRDPALCAALGRNARQRVEERFDSGTNIQAYVALFQARSGVHQVDRRFVRSV